MTGPTVVFVWRRTPPPLLIGGAEVSQQLLAEEFVRAGWRVVYLGSHEAPWNGSRADRASACPPPGPRNRVG
ncbi:hypothetical protein GCM10017778_00670 [Streptomyces vinaceus]|nr:hypothetical protein GCM10017778_00670 [Streptomyces vinaceus]